MKQRMDGLRAQKYTKVEIINAADRLTRKYQKALGDLAILGMNFDRFYEHVIYPDYDVQIEENCNLGYDADGSKILGQFEPASNTVYIDSVLATEERDPRRTFTLFHEVAGHGALQGEWIRSEFARLRKGGRLTTTEAMLDPRTTNTLEWQANVFASHAAAPSWLLNHCIRSRLRLSHPIQFLGRGEYSVDVARHTYYYFAETFDDVCRQMAYRIQCFFGGLSVEALSYRIAESGWAVDQTTDAFRLQRAVRRELVPCGI